MCGCLFYVVLILIWFCWCVVNISLFVSCLLLLLICICKIWILVKSCRFFKCRVCNKILIWFMNIDMLD